MCSSKCCCCSSGSVVSTSNGSSSSILPMLAGAAVGIFLLIAFIQVIITVLIIMLASTAVAGLLVVGLVMLVRKHAVPREIPPQVIQVIQDNRMYDGQARPRQVVRARVVRQIEGGRNGTLAENPAWEYAPSPARQQSKSLSLRHRV